VKGPLEGKVLGGADLSWAGFGPDGCNELASEEKMNRDPIVRFALANTTPEFMPEAAAPLRVP